MQILALFKKFKLKSIKHFGTILKISWRKYTWNNKDDVYRIVIVIVMTCEHNVFTKFTKTSINIIDSKVKHNYNIVGMKYEYIDSTLNI